MRRLSLHPRLLSVIAPALLLSLVAGPAWADELDGKGFGLRLSAALSRASRYPDSMAIGGAGAGSPWSSSPNPASSGMNPSVGKSGWGASAQHFQILLEAGSRVRVTSLSAAIEGGRWGSWQPAVLSLDTNRATTRDGLTFDWEARSAEVQWARKLGRCTSVGVNLNFLESDLRFGIGPTPVSKSTSETYGVRFGVLRKASERFYAGASIDYSAAPARTTTFDFMGLGVGDVTEKDTTHSLLLRTGFYTFLTKDLTAYVDYQYARFKDDTDSLALHRFYAGLDQTVREGVYLRGGTVLDSDGNASFTFGVGVAFSESIFLDVAWQYEMFPELRPEFGRSDVLGIGLTVLL